MMSASFAQTPILVEDFNYPVDTNIVGPLVGWTVNSGTANPLLVTAPGLTYSGYIQSGVGNKLSLTTTGYDAFKPFTSSVTSGSVYASFMLNISNAQATGDYFVALLPDNSTSNYTARLNARSQGTGFELGVTKGSGTPTNYVPLNFGTTYFVIIKYEFLTGSTSDDVISVYVFSGAIPTTEPATSTIASVTGGADSPNIGRFAVRQGNSSNAPTLSVDGIRVVTSWADINPASVISADPVTSLNFTSTTTTTTNINWTLPTSYQSANNTVLVFLKEGSAITQGTPSSAVGTYTANANFGAAGTPYQNDALAKCVYSGDGSSVSITGLTANTTYHALIYNVVDGSSTYSTAVTGNVTTSALPTLPVVSFGQTTMSFNEGAGQVTATGTLSNANTLPVTFDLVIIGGTATSADHSFVSPFQGGAPGGYNGPLAAQFNIVDDNLVEGNETVILTFANLNNCVVDPLFDTLVVTITDNDFSSLSFNAANYTATEGVTDSVEVKVRYINPSLTATSVTVTATAGTATQGAAADYVFLAGGTTVTFNGVNDTLKSVKIKIVDRYPFESTEQFTVNLTNPTNNATLGTNPTATVEILNRASYPYYPIGQINTVDPVNFVCDSLTKRFEVRGVVYGINLRPAGLQVSIRDNTGGIGVFNATGNLGYANATEGDSIIVIGQVDQFNGLAQIGFIDTIMVKATGRPVEDPIFTTTLGEPEENNLVYFTNVYFTNPTPPTNWVVAGSGSNFNVTNGVDTFDIRIVPAMADIAGVSVPSGPFTVVGIGGQFDSSLPRNSGYQLFPRKLSDIFEGGPSVRFSSGSATVLENAGTSTVNVLLQNPVAVGATVTVEIDPASTATLGSDFTISNTNFYFPANQNPQQPLVITINDDNLFENAETIVLNLTVSQPGTLGAVSTHTVTITDNDPNSVNEYSANSSIKVYPNPSTDRFNVTAENRIERIVVMDVTGKVVFTNNGVNALNAQVNLSNLPNGVYMMQVFQADKAPATKRLIKK